MGRPRKAKALKVLEGAQPCRINHDEPQPPKGFGDVPDHLDEVGRLAWLRITTRLDEMGVLTLADGEAVALYASIYSRWIGATKALAEDGMTITNSTETETNKGTTTKLVTKMHPMVQVATQCQQQMTRLLTQFGMTPIARSSLNAPGKAQEDPIFAFLDSPQVKVKAKGQKKA
jgi:P27 family predicted phage terminase small subunit